MQQETFISVIAPLHNLATQLDAFVPAVLTALRTHYHNYELVLVDDGSTDHTSTVLQTLSTQHSGLRVLSLSRQFGTENAIAAGLDTVIGDFVVVMLPEMDPPTLIPQLVERARQGVDIVHGVRTSRATQHWLTRGFARLFYAYCRRFLKLEPPQNATHFCCLSRRAVNTIIKTGDHARSLRLVSTYVGYPRAEFRYTPLSTKDYRFTHTAQLAMTLLIEHSSHPLRVVSVLSVLVAFSNLVYMGYVIAIYIFKETVMPGWTTLSLQTGLQFFLISLILAALSEYIGRILTRVQNRPPYIVMHEQLSNVPPSAPRLNVTDKPDT